MLGDGVPALHGQVCVLCVCICMFLCLNVCACVCLSVAVTRVPDGARWMAECGVLEFLHFMARCVCCVCACVCMFLCLTVCVFKSD